MAQTAWLRGDRARARTLADTACAGFLRTLAGAPNDAQRIVFLGLAQAYAGRTAEAREAAARGER